MANTVLDTTPHEGGHDDPSRRDFIHIAAVAAAVPLVELNLGGAPQDPRLPEARALRARAQSSWCSASASP